MTMTGRRQTEEPHTPTGESQRTSARTPRRPATRPAQVSLDAESCNVYLMAVVRGKKRPDGERMANYLWGEAGAEVIESRVLFDGTSDFSLPVASPVAIQEAGDAVKASVPHTESSRWRKRRSSCPPAQPSWLLRSGVLIADADTSPYRPVRRGPEPSTSLGPRAILVGAGSGDVPCQQGLSMPFVAQPTRLSGDSCSSPSSKDSWSGNIASDPGFLPPSPSQSDEPYSGTDTLLAPLRASLEASLAPTPDDAPAIPERSSAEHGRRVLVAPKPLSLRQLLGYGHGEPDEGPSRPAPTPSHSPVRALHLPEPSPKPLSLRQLLGYGGGEPDTEPSTPTRSPVRESPKRKPSPRPLSLRQLLGYGGSEADEESRSPSPSPSPRSPARDCRLPQPARALLKRRLFDQPPASSDGPRSSKPGRIVSPRRLPDSAADMCSMRVKHGATGWF